MAEAQETQTNSGGLELTIKEVDSVTRQLDVQVPAERVRKDIDSVYRELGKEANIRGFRKGKAPRKVLQKHYKDRVEHEVIQEIIRGTLGPIIEEKGIRLVARPSITDAKIHEDESMSYSATLEVRPEFDLPTYSGLKVQVPLRPVEESEVEEQLEGLRDRNADLSPIIEDRPLALGDFAIIDYETFVGAAKLQMDEKASENITIEMREGQLLEEFEKGLPGMKVGETRPVEATFPENHPKKELAGKKVLYRVTLKAMKKKDLPTLDDEFAKGVGTESLEELKSKIRSELVNHRKKQREGDVRKALLGKILEESNFEVPPSVLERQLGLLQSSALEILGENRLKMDPDGTQKLNDQLKNEAIKRGKEVILLERIIEKEGIQVAQEDFQTEYERLAQQYQQPVESVAAHHEDPKRKEGMYHQLREAKALDFLIRNNKVTE